MFTCPPLDADSAILDSLACHAGLASGASQGKTGRGPLLLACDAAGGLEVGPTGREAASARMYHPELIRHPDSCPALVLNADYTPLSYYPLSLWPWQT